MSDPRHELGQRGEALAERFLRGRGLKTVARNFATPAGELDRVMRDGDTIVFVEVKTRCDRRLCDPEESVRSAKLTRMTRAANWFLSQRRWSDRACRFDVVSIVLPPQGEPEIEHFEDVQAG
jgi:putative endonuclease